MVQGATYHKLNSAFPSITAIGSVTWNPGSIADHEEEAKEVTATGASLGDFVVVSFSLDVTDLQLDGHVTAADTVTCVLSNSTTGSINLGSGTLRVICFDLNSGK